MAWRPARRPEASSPRQRGPSIETFTAKQIESARAERGRDRWLSDGGGRFLHVRPTGSRARRLRYTVDGKRRILDLGDATLKSLADARIEANDLREIIDAGLDPIEEARKQKAAQQAEELSQQAEIASRRSFSKAVHAWVVGHQLARRKDWGVPMLSRPLMVACLLVAVACSCSAVAAQRIAWIGGWGSATCGDLLAHMDQQPDYKVTYTEWLQGFISGENIARSARGNSLVGSRTSVDTIEELWISMCRQPTNVPKPFLSIAIEIYGQLRASGG